MEDFFTQQLKLFTTNQIKPILDKLIALTKEEVELKIDDDIYKECKELIGVLSNYALYVDSQIKDTINLDINTINDDSSLKNLIGICAAVCVNISGQSRVELVDQSLIPLKKLPSDCIGLMYSMCRIECNLNDDCIIIPIADMSPFSPYKMRNDDDIVMNNTIDKILHTNLISISLLTLLFNKYLF